MDIIKYTNIKQSIRTISGLVASKHFKASGITIGQFVSTKDASKVTNLERIYERYRSSDFNNSDQFLTDTKTDINKMKSLDEIGVKSFIPMYDILIAGTELVVNLGDIHNNMDIPEASTERAFNVEPFMDKVLKDLMNDTDFIDVRGLDDGGRYGILDQNPQATVWMWSKAFGSNSPLDGKIFDLTPFLKSVSVSKDKQNGTFSISLAYAYDDFKVLSKSTVYDSVINRIDSLGANKRNKSQFHDLISKNDIVFIRLNRLKNELNVRNSDSLLDLQPSDLVGNIYDMMGLVDNVRDGFGGASDHVTVSITGRDFTKLLADDGSSIYQNRYVSSGKTSEEIELNGDVFRLWGKTSSLFQLQDQPIGKQLQFIIDYMTRSKICEGLFDSNPKARLSKMLLPDGSSLVASDVSGIWKIINVGVDTAIANHTSFNSRIGNDYSPILSQLTQVCQEPFVELYTDTYGDQFSIMARRPIFDKESVIHYSKDMSIKTVREYNILSDSLDYDDRVYSWYKVDIRYLSAAFDADFKWLFPAKYFQEYADIFGDKPLQVENPYISYEMAESNSKETVLLGKKMILAGVKDFKYIIECHAYLPFTRKGTITIVGDRTYKRGTWFYNEGTDEMFYIDSVAHSMSFSSGTVEWVTVLTVSRGMVRMIIDKYFQIIDMPIPAIVNDNFQAFLESTLIGWNVNPRIFNQFIKRKQVDKDDTEKLINDRTTG